MKKVCEEDPPSLSSSKWSPVFVGFMKKCLVRDVNKRASINELMMVVNLASSNH